MAQPTIKQFQLGTIDADAMGGQTPDHYEGYDIAIFRPGKITAVSTEVARYTVPRQFTIPNGFTGSYTTSRTITSGSQNFNIWQGGLLIGYIQYSPGTGSGAIINAGPAGPFVFTPGTILTIYSTTADGNQEDISIVLKGEVS